ncbi:MAG: hypothetical protein ABR579_03250 [Actinomycetota bacterium]
MRREAPQRAKSNSRHIHQSFTNHGPKDNPTKIAIVGGTGKYNDASGTAFFRFHQGNASTLTLSIDY